MLQLIVRKQPLFVLGVFRYYVFLFFLTFSISVKANCSFSLESFDPYKSPAPILGHIDSVVVALRNSKGHVLMARRGEASSHSGSFALLGGKVDPGESLEEALRRELFEEARITMFHSLQLELVVRTEDIQASAGRFYRVFVFSAILDSDYGFQSAEPTKNEEMGWVDFRNVDPLFPPSRVYWGPLLEILNGRDPGGSFDESL